METGSSAWWIYALLSAFFAALTTILAKIGVENVSSNLATAIRTVVILLIHREDGKLASAQSVDAVVCAN